MSHQLLAAKNASLFAIEGAVDIMLALTESSQDERIVSHMLSALYTLSFCSGWACFPHLCGRTTNIVLLVNVQEVIRNNGSLPKLLEMARSTNVSILQQVRQRRTTPRSNSTLLQAVGILRNCVNNNSTWHITYKVRLTIPFFSPATKRRIKRQSARSGVFLSSSVFWQAHMKRCKKTPQVAYGRSHRTIVRTRTQMRCSWYLHSCLGPLQQKIKTP